MLKVCHVIVVFILVVSSGCAYSAANGVSSRDTWGTKPLGPDVAPLQWKPAEIKRPLQSRLKKAVVTGESLTLARNGKSLATIVLPVKASASAREAATALQNAWQKMSSAKLPIVAEDKLKVADPATTQEVVISLGQTQLAKEAGVTSSDLVAGGYRLKTQGKVLFVVGNDEGNGLPANGTRNAAYALLERHFGCRWLWPGATGEVFPQQDDLILDPLNEQDEPALPVRGIRDAYAPAPSDRTLTSLARLGRGAKSYIEKKENSGTWFDAMLLGKSVKYSYGHAYSHFWKTYGKTHPEFFALQPDGTRDQGDIDGPRSDRARLDVSNPELVKTIADALIERFRENPQIASASISPNDGGSQGFDMSEADRLLDPPNAPKITLNLGKGHSSAEYVSLSDRYVTFYANIAKRVQKEFPDKVLGAYAYSAYRTPPLYAKLPSNVMIGFVGLGYFNEKQRLTDLQSWDEWTRAAHQLFLRPNVLHGGHGFPAVYVHKLAADVKHCYQTGMVGTDFDSVMHNWAGQGLNYYVLARLLWDPSLNVDDVVKDYCDNGFGSASPTIQKYFAALEELTNTIASNAESDAAQAEDAISSNSYYSSLYVLSRYFTEDNIDNLQEILDQAKVQVSGDDVVLQRINFLEQGIRYARAEAAPLRLLFSEEPLAHKDQIVRDLEKRQQVFQDLYDNHFYAQNTLTVLHREGTFTWRKFGWKP